MTATVEILGSRAYRAGVSRGWERADRMYAMEGLALFPSREDILRALPFWVEEDSPDAEDYIEGFSRGFDNRVRGCWANGLKRDQSNDGCG